MKWELHLLGGFQLKIDDKNIDLFEADSARALCAYLCLHAGKTIRRDRLAALMWPEQPQSEALRNLRTALSRLRRGLGPLGDALVATNQAVGIDLPAEASVDVATVIQLATAVSAHRHRRLAGCPFCMQSAQRIAVLYQGELLAGFDIDSEPFQEWLMMEREMLHRTVLDILTALSTHHLERAEWREAAHYAQQVLRFEPWREEGHRLLMQALAGAGQRSTALRQYRICAEVLHNELGAPPDAATVAVFEQIRAPDSPKSPQSAPGTVIKPGGTHWLDDLPLIGREHELTTLMQQLVSPATRLVTVVGESGIGKTRLALRAARQTAISFPDGVFFINLNPDEQPAPTTLQRTDATAYVAQQIALACQIPPDARTDLQQTVQTYLQPRSVLLLLDSFEQCEHAAPFLLALLEAAPACVLLVTTHRTLNLRQEHVLRLDGLGTPSGHDPSAPTAPSLALFIALAQQRGLPDLLHSASRETIAQICMATGGLPLSIELAVACLAQSERLEAPHLRPADVADLLLRTTHQEIQTLLDLPPRQRSLRALLRTAWQLLEPEQQQALAGIAIFHTAFSLEMAAAVLTIQDREQVMHLFCELTDRALLQIVEPGRFRLHDHIHRFAAEQLIALPAYRSIRSRYCVAFLRQLAAAERTLDGRDSFFIQQAIAGELEDYLAAWSMAIDDHCWELLAEATYAFARFHALRGLDEAGERLLSDAVTKLRQAQHHQVTTHRQPLARLLVARCRLLMRLERKELVAALLQDALALADDPATRVDALIEHGWRLYHDGRTRDAEQPLCAALKEAERLGDVGRKTLAINGLAAIHHRRGEISAAQDSLETALRLARQQDDASMMAIILSNLGVHYSELGEHARAIQLLTEAQAIHLLQRNLRMVVNTLYVLGIQYDALGQYIEAQAHYHRALTIANSINDRFSQLDIWINIGISLDQMGDYAGAIAASQRALEIESDIHKPQARCTLFANLSLHFHHIGDQPQALSFARRATDLANQIEMPLMAAYGYDFQGHALLAMGNIRAAAEAYAQALHLREQHGAASLALESRAGMARTALAQHDLTTAVKWIEPIAAYILREPLQGLEEPLRVYWTVYEALRMHQDPTADAILARAAEMLYAHAQQFTDPAARQRYLTQVEVHSRLLQAAAECDAASALTLGLQAAGACAP